MEKLKRRARSSLKKIIFLRKNEPNVEENQTLTDKSLFRDNFVTNEEEEPAFKSVRERQYNAFSDTDDEDLNAGEIASSPIQKQSTSTFPERSAIFNFLKLPFSLAALVPEKVLQLFQSALKMLSAIAVTGKSRKIIIQKEEDPERMSRRLRGIDPEEFNMTKNRRRSKRSSDSTIKFQSHSAFA